mmetsp:Transcript_76015/g.134241  ORF Transcript_76015/g.134241 Transcript_76015/m.134241 type:complete len:164 (-) Transcript_76015:286-777(-)
MEVVHVGEDRLSQNPSGMDGDLALEDVTDESMARTTAKTTVEEVAAKQGRERTRTRSHEGRTDGKERKRRSSSHNSKSSHDASASEVQKASQPSRKRKSLASTLLTWPRFGKAIDVVDRPDDAQASPPPKPRLASRDRRTQPGKWMARWKTRELEHSGASADT